MRITGMSEAEIYYLSHQYWEHPLSYGQMRKAFKDAGVDTRHKAALARRKGDTIRYEEGGKDPHWEREPGKYKYGGERVGRRSPYLTRRDSVEAAPGDRASWAERRSKGEERRLTQRELLSRQYFFNRSLSNDVPLARNRAMDHYDLYYSRSGQGY